LRRSEEEQIQGTMTVLIGKRSIRRDDPELRRIINRGIASGERRSEGGIAVCGRDRKRCEILIDVPSLETHVSFTSIFASPSTVFTSTEAYNVLPSASKKTAKEQQSFVKLNFLREI